jgi:EAL domain-containing protein (putative c-di-GMP-specific phosphodiesterase class I)
MIDPPPGNRLLIVDDEQAFATLIRRAAEQVGFEVKVADDARTFLTMVRCWRPTLVILDLRMPDMDGIQLLRALAADKFAGQVIVGSGTDQRVLDTAMRLGHERGLLMGGTLQKPVRIELLQDLLAGFCRVPKQLLATDLAEAIATDQLFLEYQPKFDCRLGRFTGVEALIRWRHPKHGVVRPDEFIPLAESTDQIHRLTDWAVFNAARQAALWHADNLLLDVAVNISARDIEDIELPERLEQHCRNAGIDPSAIILELTETSAMREAVQMMDVLTRLRLKEFRLAIDDFGTGYSSLVQLQRMPFSEIKIDKSFVMYMSRNDDCRIIAKIVIDLARELGLTSVAEGVEDEAALMVLVDMGCHIAQGYYLSRPIAADRIAEVVRGDLSFAPHQADAA